MGRRSDHSRPELREMIVAEGHRQMLEVGFARFAAREVAKRIGYSIGTIGIHRLGLLLALNAGFWSAACMILAGPLYHGSFPEWWSWWRSRDR